MLVSSQKLLKDARAKGYAIGAFNTNNLEFTQAIINAAEKIKKPVIVQTSPKALDYAGTEELLGIIRLLGEKASVPVVVHLDHGKDPALIKKLIKLKLHTSLMFDGSALDYEENVRQTAELVKLAHTADMSLEAELGAIGGREDYVKSEIKYTNPEQASDFVARTGCDSLAIAIGNVHGEKIASEELRLDILETIAQKVAIPLVLHGSSNSTDQEFHRAIGLGVAKVNIDTELRQAFAKAIRKFLSDQPNAYDPREILSPATKAISEVVAKRLALFNP